LVFGCIRCKERARLRSGRKRVGHWIRGLLDGDGEGVDGGLGFVAGDFSVFESGFGEGYGFGGEVDRAVDAVQVGEIPEVLPEGFVAPVDVVACGFAAGEVVGSEVVVDEAGGDGLFVGDGEVEEAAAEGEGGHVANAGGAFGEEDDGEVVAKALGHTFGGLGDAVGATGGAIDVDGAGHHADPSEHGCLADFDLGDEDAGADGAVNDYVDVGEVVGDDGAMHGDGAYSGERDVLGAEEAVADAAEPGGAEGAGAGAGDQHFQHGVGEDGGEREDTVDATGRAEKRQTEILRRGQ